ncbi:MAG: hypothetical protein NC217_06850 [Muribaculaceae bacterium]|nr:hypothetical protein [Muribaculaceae bacterium]
MKRFIFALLLVMTVLCPAIVKAQVQVPGQWRLHNTFGNNFSEIIDTPDRVYLLALGQSAGSSGVWAQPSGQLFVLDKASDELTGYNANNYLSNNVILDIAYNAAKKYLLIVYDDYTMDILSDDDKVYTIPGLASASLSTSKNINSITFDAAQNKAYLAADFGYIVIDDKRRVISESHVYNTKLTGIGRVGDSLLICRDGNLYSSPVEGRHSELEDFKLVDSGLSDVAYLLPLSDDTFGLTSGSGLSVGKIGADGSVSFMNVDGGTFKNYAENKAGYLLVRWGCVTQFSRSGDVERVYTESAGYPNGLFASWGLEDIYMPLSQEGIVQYAKKNNSLSAQTQVFTPNAPEPYGVFGFEWSDKVGMLASNSTFNRVYSVATNNPSMTSAYDGGQWTAYGNTATVSAVGQDMIDTYQPILDPINDNLLWMGSRRNGLVRYDLEDGTAELFSQPQHDKKGEKGFHAVFPYSDKWSMICDVSSPSFDAQGNLWCIFNPSQMTTDNPQPIYVWKASDRKTGNVAGFKNIPVKGYAQHYDNHICTATKNGNFVVFGPSYLYQGPFYLYYHGGTVDDTSDDKLFKYQTFIDQDGNQIPYLYINQFYEDPSTGYIWVCTDSGVFYFNPNDALRAGDSGGTLHVRRVKVSRNDGTNLADYLLDGYDVMCMASDGASRKWFGTMGSGIVVASADGSTVLEQFNTSNSRLPSDNVYSVGFDPTGNAVWIGSGKQIATYYCDATTAADDYSEILAFPNPVRPEYAGPVTIKGLMSNSLVKIVNPAGEVIKELGLSNGGMAMWDLTDMQGRDVGAGVYYIMASTTGESTDSKGATTKILVIR